MLPAVAGAAIAAGATALGTGGQIYAAGKMNKKTRQWNEKMYGIQRADALADWNTQNAYNSPEQQMQRLKEAGLNPNLVYGTGADATAGPVRSTESKSWSPSPPDLSGVGRAASEGLQAYHDITLQQEQVKNMQAQRQNMELDSIMKGVQISGEQVKTARSGLELSKATELYDTSIATANERLRNLSSMTDIAVSNEARNAALHAPNLASAFERLAKLSIDSKAALVQLDNLKKTGQLQQLELNMRKLGLSFNDGVILRMIAQFAGGKSLPDIVKNIYQYIRGAADTFHDSGKYKDEVKVSPSH